MNEGSDAAQHRAAQTCRRTHRRRGDGAWAAGAAARDPTVSDILVNGPHQVYVERRGKLELTDVRFNDDKHLMNIIDRIVSAVGRRIDESSPMVDARLKDGSRVNAIIPPLAIDGPMLSIRRFAVELLSHEDLIKLGTMIENRGACAGGHRARAAQRARLRRHRRRQDHACSIFFRASFRRRSASSRSRTPRSCSFVSRTWCGWRRGRRTSKARVK